MASLLDALKKYITRAKDNVVQATKPYVQQKSKIFTQGIPNLVKSAANTAYEAPRDFGQGIVKSFQANQDADRLLSKAKSDTAISQQNIQKAVALKKSGNLEGYKQLLAVNNRPSTAGQSIDKFIQDTQAEKRKTQVAAVKTAGLLPGVFSTGKASYALAAALSGGIGALSGEDPFTSAGKGITQAKQYGLVSQFTNPLIRQVGNNAAGAIKNPLVRALSYRTISGLGNVAENEILAKGNQQPQSAGDRLTSFAVGAAMGGKYKGQDKREANFSTLMKTELGRKDSFKLPPDEAEKVAKGLVEMKRISKGIIDAPMESAKEKISRRIDELSTKELMTKDEMIFMPKFDETKEEAVERIYKTMWLAKQKGAIDFGAKVSIGKGKNVNPEASGEVVQAKSKVLPAETTRLLPWESPDQKVDTSLEGIEASRTSIKPSVSETGVTTPKPKLQTSSLKVSSDESITPPKTIEVQNTSKAVGKVNLLDWFRTPDRVMKKIGLGKEAELLRTKYNDYLDELPKNIDKITGWYEQVKGSPDASKRLFQYLDGQKVDLSPQEMKVAGEMQSYLKEWADRLDLPYDKRIASYITHIFDKDFIQKDFDEDLAKIISEKIPGSVYDPFLQQRLGKNGYVEDVFKALDAYTKRATRKVHMDEALGKIQDAEYKLDLDSWKYVKSYTDRINLRPQQVDNYLDNFIKQTPLGYKLGVRPTAAISRFLRRSVYRGTLGLNIGSAVRNLTQGVNTYAKLGEKYTGIGYIKAFKAMATGNDELIRSGVLRDNIVQDRQLSAVKGFMEKLDKGLFAFFNFAEKVNRGSAYFGAKAKYLAQGLPEDQAIKKAIDLARDTQFTFGSVDTPVALQGDAVKLFTQFQSFNVKQTEFVAELAQKKEWAGMIRWVGANLAIVATVGSTIGIDFKDMIPFYNVLTGETKLGDTPPFKLAKGVTASVNKSPDEYGNIPEGNLVQRLANNKDVTGSLTAFVPGGVQIKKTIEGLKAYSQGASTSKTGRVRYPIEPGVGNAIRAATFGQYNLPGAKQYFDESKTPLGDKQSQEFLNLKPEEKKAYYDSVMTQRQKGNEEDKVYEALDKGDYSAISKSTPKASAEAVYRYINKQDKANRQATYDKIKDNLPQEVKDNLKTIRELDSKGIGKKDRDIMLIPQEVRARAVFDRIMDLDPKNRQKKYDQLVEMGVITPSMKLVLQRLIKEAKK